MSVLVTDERPRDAAAIADLIDAAFAGAPHASGTEAAIVDRLRADGDLVASLVALEDGAVIGHIALSPARIGAAAGWFAIGPVAVAPGHQRRGIGAQLIRAALERLRGVNAAGAVLVGDPAFYGRFGFAAVPGLTYSDIPGQYVQRLALAGPDARGEIAFAPAFDGA